MPRDRIQTVYTFQELPEGVQDELIKQAQQSAGELFDDQAIYEDAISMGVILGIEIDTHTVNLVGVGHRH